MPQLHWKYATNQFLSATEDNFSLVNEINDTHLPSALYQLWLTGRNGRGQSDPSPAVSWTAPV